MSQCNTKVTCTYCGDVMWEAHQDDHECDAFDLRYSLDERDQELSELRGRLARLEDYDTALREYVVNATYVAALSLVAAAFFLFKWQQVCI